MDGYVLIERSALNICGVVTLATYPNIPAAPGSPTSSPTSVDIPQNQKTTYPTVLGKNDVVQLPHSGSNAYAVTFTSATLGGMAIGASEAVSLPCRNIYATPSTSAALWIIGTVVGGSTYLSSIMVTYNIPWYSIFASEDSSVSVIMPPFEVPNFDLPLSCETLNTYWVVDYTGDTYFNSLEYGSTVSSPGVSVTSLTYFVDPNPIVSSSLDDLPDAEQSRYGTLWSGVVFICVSAGLYIIYRRNVDDQMYSQLISETDSECQSTSVTLPVEGAMVNGKTANLSLDGSLYQEIEI